MCIDSFIIIIPYSEQLGDEQSDEGDDNDYNESPDPVEIIETPKPVKKSRKKKNKKKNLKESEDTDDLTEILREMKIDLPKDGVLTSTSSHILKLNTSYLNPTFEMSKMYGKDVVKEDNKSRVKVKNPKRFIFDYKPEWPDISRDTIPIDIIEIDRKDDTPRFKCIRSDKYNQVQEAFISAYNSGNIMNLENILMFHPYHIDTLLEFSDSLLNIAKERELSLDLLGKIIHKFENSINKSFNPLKFKCRLPYEFKENRCFHLAILAYIKAIGFKGCPRTALEVSKLLLSLDETDPLGVRFMIDHYAIRSNENDFLLDLYYSSEYKSLVQGIPNMMYNVALAKFRQEKKKSNKNERSGSKTDIPNANELLQDAILHFPHLILALMKQLSIGTSDISEHSHFSSSCSTHLNLYVQMFLERNAYLWKDQDTSTWIKKGVYAVIERIDSNDKETLSKLEGFKDILTHQFKDPPSNELMINIYLTLDTTANLIPRDAFQEGLNVYETIQ